MGLPQPRLSLSALPAGPEAARYRPELRSQVRAGPGMRGQGGARLGTIRSERSDESWAENMEQKANEG